MRQWLIPNQLRMGMNVVRQAQVEQDELLDFYIWRAGQAGEQTELQAPGKELGIVVLWGLVDISCGGQHFREVGGRTDVFSGRASGVFVPAGLGVRLTACTACEVALAAAPADGEGPPQLVTPQEVVVRTVGHWNWRREVHTVIGDNVSHARRLLLGETFNPPGNWSSYPPHKHSVDRYPFEVRMEELYHYRVRPAGGFGVQCLYGGDLEGEAAYIVRDGDTVVIAGAYHPVVAAPGYQVYYLWMLAGYTDRRMRPYDDPTHAWVHAVGEVARGMGL
jgi:5-deoxy-glucuronate isomerase